MRNLERNDTNELIYKTEIDSQTENEFMVTTRGYEWGEGIIREFGVNMYTLLYLKWINKNCCIAQGTLLNIM